MYPTFLGIGATKAGTTWLYANLREHPQIWLPPIKEIHYFDSKEIFSEKDHNRSQFKRRGLQFWRYRIRKRLDEGHLSLSWRHMIWYCKYFSGKKDDNWYSSLFPYRGYQVVGDISPGYDHLSSATIARIHELMPRAKIILMLRNPIYRTWSFVRMEASIFGNPNLDNEQEVLEFVANGIASENYHQIIEKWNEYFPTEQIFIGFFDEIASCPQDLLNKVCVFLEVCPESGRFSKTIQKRFNRGAPASVSPKVVKYLAHFHYPYLRELSDRFGGYANDWLAQAEKILSE